MRAERVLTEHSGGLDAGGRTKFTLPKHFCSRRATINHTCQRLTRCSVTAVRGIISAYACIGSRMRLVLRAALSATVGALCLTAGCSSRTDMSMTGNAPAQYSHVWITAQAVWFNSSATAGPDDSGW